MTERPEPPQFPVTDPDAPVPPRTRYPVRRRPVRAMPDEEHTVAERRVRRLNNPSQPDDVPPEAPEERTLPGVRAPNAARQVPYRTDTGPRHRRMPDDQRKPARPPEAAPPAAQPDAAPPVGPPRPAPKAPRIADPVRYEPDGTVIEEPAHAPVVGDEDDDVTWRPATPRNRRRRRPAKHRRHEKKPQRPFMREIPLLVVTALVLTFVIQTFIARVYMIPSGSMETTLHGCEGCTPDRVLVDKVVYHFKDPKPGDVVVFEGPKTWTENDTEPPPGGLTGFLQQLGGLVGLAPADERDFVKRVVAVGGQTIQCCDKQNRVLVDGKPINELSYLHLPAGQKQQPMPKTTVPAGRVFVMGDNRNNSADSRYQGGGGVNGTVPVDDIIGKARFIVLPASRWASISDINPQQN